MTDDTAGHEVTHAWRLRCRDCRYTWRGRSAEATPCPECASWDIITVRLEALECVEDVVPPWKFRFVP